MSAMRQPDYVELQATSNFSFLRGASHPQELALAAAALGHKAIAVTDRNSLAGLVRAHQGAKEAGIRLIVGARLDLQDGFSLLAYPTDRAAYGRLCRLLTLGKRDEALHCLKQALYCFRHDELRGRARTVARMILKLDPGDASAQRKAA